MSEESKNLPAVVPAQPTLAQTRLSGFRNPLAVCDTCFELTDPRITTAVVNGINNPDETLLTLGGKPQDVDAIGWFVQLGPRPGKVEGEIEEVLRVVLVDKDGNTIRWTSPYTTQSLLVVIGLKGRGQI